MRAFPIAPHHLDELRPAITVLGYLVGLPGLFACLALLLAQSSVFADVAVPGWAGPGVDVWVDRYVAPGEPARIEVEARGGEEAALTGIVVLRDGVPVATYQGDGPTWGSVITSGSSRGADDAAVDVPIPGDAVPGRPIPLRLRVGYVVAMSDGGTFEDEPHQEDVDVEVVPRTSMIVARALGVARGAGLAAVWTVIVVLFGWFVQAYERPGASEAETWALGGPALAGIIASAIFGYWEFARPVAEALGAGWPVEYALAAAWVIGPPIGAFRLLRRRRGVRY